MTTNGWFQIALYSAAILAITKPMGVYMYRVFEGHEQPCRDCSAAASG